jgi:hypothetical protein
MTKNLIAIAVLVILGLAAFFALREEPSAEREEARAAVAPVDADRLDRILIKRREGTGDAAVVEQIELQKKDGLWRMVAPVEYAVVAATVERMVEALGDLKVVDVIAENAESHDRFDLDAEKGIEVTALAGKEELAHLLIGKSKGGMTFVRVPGEDPVYRVQGYHRGPFNRSASALRDKTIIEVEKDTIGKVTFRGEKGDLALEAEGEGELRRFVTRGAEIENFDEAKAKGILSSLARLKARDFVDGELDAAETGLGEGAAQVVLEIAGATKPDVITLTLGKEIPKERKTYVKSSKSDQVFLVAASTAERFQVGADDFARTDEEVKEAE